MSEGTETAHRRNAARSAGRARQASLAWNYALPSLGDPAFRWIMCVWGFAIVLTVIGLALIGLRIIAPGQLAIWIGFEVPIKLVAALAIYVVVMLSGSFNLVYGIGQLGRENRAIRGAERQITYWSLPEHPVSAAFLKKDDVFVETGEDRLPDADQTAVVKLCAAIHSDALRGRFDPVTLLVDRVADQVIGGAFRIRESQQLGVRLGILGTFIGIVFSLQAVGPIMSESSTDAAVRNAILSIVESLGVAFATSIAGLLAAILLQIMAVGLRSVEIDVIEKLHRTAASVQGIYRLAATDNDQEKLAETLRQHREGLHAYTDQLNQGSHRVANSVRDMSTILDGPLAALKQSTDTLDQTLLNQKAVAASLVSLTGVISDVTREMVALHSSIAAMHEGSIRTFAETLQETQDRNSAHLSAIMTEHGRALTEEIRRGYGLTTLSRMDEQLDGFTERQLKLISRMEWRFSATLVVAGVTLILVLVALAGAYAPFRLWVWGA